MSGEPIFTGHALEAGMARQAAPRPAPHPTPMPLGWRIALGAIVTVGLCEALTMTASTLMEWLPGWLTSAIVLTGFVSFLFLGFTLNAVLAVVMPLVLWRGQGWPFWQAVLPALPFWILFSGFLPSL